MYPFSSFSLKSLNGQVFSDVWQICRNFYHWRFEHFQKLFLLHFCSSSHP
nr:hypothetical protein Iba_chr14aCG22500 [Ipomoea batatas]